jgi:chemotaxis protein MotB
VADEAENQEAAAASEDDGGGLECPKCEECTPGLPGWMATFSDLVTLLLTFFVLLLSFAKTETAKYEAALGSVRNAFGGNVFKQGEVLQPGKSPDDSPEMVDAQQPIKPFPIDFLTMEGMLDKHEINRESTETLKEMRSTLKENQLTENVDVQEIPEGIKVKIKDKIFFQQGSVKVAELDREVLDKVVGLLNENEWTLFIEGHADKGETSADGTMDAYALSSKRAEAVTKNFIRNGVRPDKITTVYYGDSRPNRPFKNSEGVRGKQNRRVEFILRKTDLRTQGHSVNPR